MAREIGDRKRIVRRAINKIGGEGAAHRVAPPVGQLGLQDTGGAGTEKYTDALRAVLCNGRAHRLGKAILHPSQQRESVVAAIKIGQVCGKLHRIHSCYLANKRRQIHRIERARREPSATLSERIKSVVKTATDTAGRGEMGKPERIQITKAYR